MRLAVFKALAASLILACLAGAQSASAEPPPAGDGVVVVRSAYDFATTVERLKQDVASKGIMFFGAVDQQKLASGAAIELHPSTLLVFGNPPLGVQFITSNPGAGLDWPVRLLVFQDDAGAVWAEYTDFGWIARRHHISDRDEAFAKAAGVIASITDAVRSK